VPTNDDVPGRADSVSFIPPKHDKGKSSQNRPQTYCSLLNFHTGSVRITNVKASEVFDRSRYESLIESFLLEFSTGIKETVYRCHHTNFVFIGSHLKKTGTKTN